MSLGADQITFAGKTIALGTTQSKVTINGGDIQVASNKTLKFSSGSIDFTGSTVTMSGDNISFSATNSFKAAVGNSGVVLSEDLISAFIEDVASADGQALSSKMGLVISRGYASNAFGFGYYTYNSSTQQYDWTGGLNFEIATENNVKKIRLSLSADTAKITAGALLLDGQTVNISANKVFTVSSSGELSLSGGTIEIEGSASVTIKSGSTMTLNSGSTLNLTAATVNLNAGQLTYSGQTIDLTAANVSLNANQITFDGKTITIAANKTLTFTSGTVGSGQTKGTIDFTGAKINMNADQLTFVGKTVINGKFSVDSNGNVTMDGFTATNATITGEINASSGKITGAMTVGTYASNKNSIKIIPDDTNPSIVGYVGTTEAFRLGTSVSYDGSANPTVKVGRSYLREVGLYVLDADGSNCRAFATRFIVERVVNSLHYPFSIDITSGKKVILKANGKDMWPTSKSEVGWGGVYVDGDVLKVNMDG